MSALPVLRTQLARGARGLVLWTLALTAVLCLYLSFYPSVHDAGMDEIVATMPAGVSDALNLDQIASGAGYAHATFFHLLGFVFLTIACVSWGSAAIAGAEEDGTLELTLAHGVGRTRYALESAASLVVRVLVAALAVTGATLALDGPAELGLATDRVLAEVASWAGLGLLAGTAALAAGGLVGRRVVATGAGAAVAVYAYLTDALASAIEDLARLRDVSPMSWVYEPAPLAHGADAAGLAGVYGLAVACVVAAAVGLRRRDVLG